MKRSFLMIPIASALLLSVAKSGIAVSKNPRSNQHQAQTAPTDKSNQNQQAQIPVVPLTILQSVQATLGEAVATIKQQAITVEKQAEPYKETFCSPSVVVNEVLALIGLGYLVVMRMQLSALKEQARIANRTLDTVNRQANIAESTLTETSRPWVYPEFKIVGDGLRDENGRARLILRVTLRNTGNSVAIETRIYMKMLLYVGGENPVDKQGEFINVIRKGAKDLGPYGLALFPGEVNELMDEELIVTNEDIEKSKRGLTGAIHPTVVGFVEYKFSFIETSKVHETRFIYEMARLSAGRMTTPNAYQDIPLQELAFFPSFNGGHGVT